MQRLVNLRRCRHEGAIGLRTAKPSFCEMITVTGWGLPARVPAGAISFVGGMLPHTTRPLSGKQSEMQGAPHVGGCPGSMVQSYRARCKSSVRLVALPPYRNYRTGQSRLSWLPAYAPYFDGAKPLIAADCTAYAYANFHQEFMCGKVTLVGCPKLDGVDYAEKLAAILRNNDIQSVTVARMEVPCCGGLRWRRRGPPR